jgi:hypothetical protein
MATVRVWFDVFDVSDDSVEALGQLHNLIDQLGKVDTELSWDNVEWREVE